MSAFRFTAALVLICIVPAACAPEPALMPHQVVPDASAPAATAPDTVARAAERGRRLAANACASCHATGPGGVSPMAAAPPFRDIVSRKPLDQLEAGFAEGLVTAHPAMPAFTFRASEIDDLIAWLDTLKAGQ